MSTSNERMIDAFEAHFDADWRDPYFAREQDCWRAAWIAAQPATVAQPTKELIDDLKAIKAKYSKMAREINRDLA